MRTFALMTATISVLVGAADRSLAAAEAQRVSFQTEDGVTIVGDYYTLKTDGQTKTPVAILLHMYKQTRQTWKPLIPALREAGFAVLAIDMRGHGESIEPIAMRLAARAEQRDNRLFAAMDKDVAAAYNWLAREHEDSVDLARLAIVGASVGCSVAIDYASGDKSVDVIVCMTPGMSYMGINSSRHIKRYGDRPILLLAAEDERRDAEALGKLASKATVTIVPTDGARPKELHGTRMFGRVKEVDKQITGFLLKHVGKPTKDPVVASIHSNVYHNPDSPYVDRIKPTNKRWFSTAKEAESRGLRASKR